MDPLYYDIQSNYQPDYFFDFEEWFQLHELRPSRFRCGSTLSRPVAERTTIAVQPGVFCQGLDCSKDFLFLAYNPQPGGGITDFVGCTGASSPTDALEPSFIWKFRGMMTSRETRTAESVSSADGLSNTIMYGETLGGRSTQGRVTRLAYLYSWHSGALARGRGAVPFGQGQESVDVPMLGNAFHSHVLGFGSFHPTGVNFAMGDGSVHSISRDIDWRTYYNLCGGYDTDR